MGRNLGRDKGGVRRLGFQNSVEILGCYKPTPLKGISPSRFRRGSRKGKGIPSSKSPHFPR
jgi:hypothetical protein